MSKDNKRVVREYFVELSPTITDLLEIELMDEEEFIENWKRNLSISKVGN